MFIEHPYTRLTGGQWLRGNLHAHTNNSDGQRKTQEVINDYARRGYDFLMISDHDVYTSPEDYAKLDSKGLILIPGNEVTANGPHILHINADHRIEPSVNRQRVLNAVQTTQGFTVINHPNWQENFDHCSIKKLTAWEGYAGVEIYNGVIGRLEGSPYATNKWDMLLGRGRRVWGFANDDSHAAKGDVGLGWNMVYARKRTLPAILESLRKGRFYASSGVAISHITVSRRRIRIETKNAERIVALQQTGCRFAQVDGHSLEVEVPGNATYVRFECWGRGESFAWTQPFFIRHDTGAHL